MLAIHLRRFAVSLVCSSAFLALLGCSSTTNSAPQALESRAASRAQALAAAVGIPEPDQFEARDLQWNDASRDRAVPARLYLPRESTQRVPLVIFSHGIGGSREGYSYIGKYLAAQGMAALHVQHVGSDRSLWFGNPVQMVSRLQEAAKESEAIDRTADMRFALDQILADPQLGPRIDAERIAAAGHSYGANTTMLLAGARVQREGRVLDMSDPRIKAAVIISAPPFYGEGDPRAIVGSIRVPSLHITATGDEIKIPGYFSSAQDRVAVYEATGTKGGKWLAVFEGGSHSMFTDRLGTGGEALNPQVKKATRELMLAFLRQEFSGDTQALRQWPGPYGAIMARFERKD
jgi:dienelactone hydrolase